MNQTLRRAARLVERRPAAALGALLVLTLVLGVFAGQQTTETDMAAFAPESELARSHDRIADEFGSAGDAAVQLILDAGPDGDVLSPDGFEAADRLVEAVVSSPGGPDVLASAGTPQRAVVSFTGPFRVAQDDALHDEASDAQVTELLVDPEAGAQAAALLSQDLDVEAGTARAGLLIVRLAADLPAGEEASAELGIRDAVAGVDLPGFDVRVFSEQILSAELQRDMEEELPVLLALAFALIIAILLITYRRISDVLLGLGGLIVTIVWTYGISVLLGPEHLGVTGPMTQISMMIPVLLIGLAVDYSIHLTSRYREESNAGQTPARAANAAVFSVGGALVLATITTMIGFLTNLASPLAPIRDFGLFVAAGVLSAFVVMLLLVPSARSLLDRRRSAKGTFAAPASGTGTRMGRAMGRAAVLAEHHALATLVTAGVVTVLAVGAATQVSTTFSQDDFIPEDSDVGRLLESMDELFGGDLEETTYVLLDGDLARPEAFDAMLRAQERMTDTPHVRAAAGSARIVSPATVLTSLTADPELGTRLEQLGLTPGAVRDDADMAAIYELGREVAPEALDGVLTPDHRTAIVSVATSAGQDGATGLRADLQEDIIPLEEQGLATTIVSEMLMFEESLDALRDSQTRGIAITLLAALLVLVGFFSLRDRRPLLGVVTMVPSVLVVAWVLGSMWLLGISFNVMTAMVASLAIGIGVPYGIHITNRFTEDLRRTGTVDGAVRETVTHTGAALLGSAATTAAGFGVLGFASLAPMQQFGIITALTIVYSMLAAVLVEPACLKLWAEWRRRRDGGMAPALPERPVREPVG
jgi:uncharacterized protein